MHLKRTFSTVLEKEVNHLRLKKKPIYSFSNTCVTHLSDTALGKRISNLYVRI